MKLSKDAAEGAATPAQPAPPAYEPPTNEPATGEAPTYIPSAFTPPTYGQPSYQQPSYEPPAYPPPASQAPPTPDPNSPGGYGPSYQQPDYQTADPYQQYGQQSYGQQGLGQPYGYGYGAQPGYPGGAYGYGPTTSGKATAVMVVGICAVATVWCYGLGVIPAIVALAMAGSAKREIEASGGRLTGLGMITAGKVTSWITLGLAVLFGIFIAILIVIGATTDSGSSYSGY